MALIPEKKFAEMVAKRCNYLPEQVILDVYRGMLRTFRDELRDRGVAELPYWGRFVITKQKAKVMRTGTMRRVPETNTLRFKPIPSLKKYLKQIPDLRDWRE